MISDNITSHIEKKYGTITNIQTVGGGCIADTYKISTTNQSLFIKCGNLPSDMLIKEGHGLQELALAKSIHIPKVIDVTEDFLLLEYIEQGIRDTHFFAEFGASLANMHTYTSETCGFYEDNYLGYSYQKNTLSTNWVDFYVNNRLFFQIELMKQKNLECSELERLLHSAEKNIRNVLSTGDSTFSLLHGDLWGGNYMITHNGKPCLIDPAVYYGNREADLAMTKLFGGFTAEFYEAYMKTYPLPAGYKKREPLYTLYHIMNHYTLFGGGYYSHALSIIQKYL
ncbi:MAG: fructosamine kinase family protein [Bacteroidales bacterium]